MGKKSIPPSIKNLPKHEKEHNIKRTRILRSKVYITDPSNFKSLVQELAGNNGNSPVSSPPPSISAAIAPSMDVIGDNHHQPPDQEDDSLELSFDSYSSCFTTILEGSSPGLGLAYAYSFNCVNVENSQRIEFPSQFLDLESLLMGMDSVWRNCDACYAMNAQQEGLCVMTTTCLA